MPLIRSGQLQALLSQSIEERRATVLACLIAAWPLSAAVHNTRLRESPVRLENFAWPAEQGARGFGRTFESSAELLIEILGSRVQATLCIGTNSADPTTAPPFVC